MIILVLRYIFEHPIQSTISLREALSSHVWCTQLRGGPFVTNLSSPTSPQESAPNSCRVALQHHAGKKYINIHNAHTRRRRTDVSITWARRRKLFLARAPVVAASHRRDNKLPTNVLMKYHQRTDAWLLSQICRPGAAENRSMKPLGRRGKRPWRKRERKKAGGSQKAVKPSKILPGIWGKVIKFYYFGICDG